MSIPNYSTVTGLAQASNVAPMIAALTSGAATSMPTAPARYGVGPAATASINQMLGEVGQIGASRLGTQYNLARTPISSQLGWQGQMLNSNQMLNNARLAADQDAFMRNFAMQNRAYQAQRGAQSSSILTQLLNPFLGSMFGGLEQ